MHVIRCHPFLNISVVRIPPKLEEVSEMKKATLVIASLMLLISQLSLANSIDDRQKNQRARIGNGVQSGELTALETGRLVKQQAHIRATEARYKADGDFTLRERASIHRKQNQASARIFQQKHDDQSRN